MKTYFLVFNLIFLTTYSSFAQTIEDSIIYYVLNVFGADIYEKPSLESKIIGKIKVGEKVIPFEIVVTNESKKIWDDFYLEGDFLKFRRDSLLGYVFSSDLTKYKPQIWWAYPGNPISNINGKEINRQVEKSILEKRTSIRRQKNEFGKYQLYEFEYDHLIEEGTIEFENVSLIYKTGGLDIIEHVFIYKNLTLSEVYHQIVNLYTIIDEVKGETLFPRSGYREGNDIFFDDHNYGPIDLKIIEFDKQTYITLFTTSWNSSNVLSKRYEN